MRIAIALAAALVTTSAAAPPGSLIDHLDRRAVPAPLTQPGPDLAQLDRLARGATVVGLGEAAHSVSELTRHKTRAVRAR